MAIEIEYAEIEQPVKAVRWEEGGAHLHASVCSGTTADVALWATKHGHLEAMRVTMSATSCLEAAEFFTKLAEILDDEAPQ